jgi:FdhD protein
MVSREYEGLRIKSDSTDQVSDFLVVEHPLSISVNGTPFTLTMQTPGQEEVLARGLLFTEGIVRNRKGVIGLNITSTSKEGFISSIDAVIPETELDKSLLNKRNLLSAASCGICGKTELIWPEIDPLKSEIELSAMQVDQMFQVMASHQEGFRLSGGSHGAALFDADHQLLTIKEDIGRHNAVDKTIGDLLQQGVLEKAQFMLVSGRISYEIISKCFIAGIPFLLAVSAPSSLAVDFAKELGITLAGFCREGRATFYSLAGRIRG